MAEKKDCHRSNAYGCCPSAKEFEAVHIPMQDIFDEALSVAPAVHWIWDGIHPLPAGHEIIARSWLDGFLPVGQVNNLDRKSHVETDWEKRYIEKDTPGIKVSLLQVVDWLKNQNLILIPDVLSQVVVVGTMHGHGLMQALRPPELICQNWLSLRHAKISIHSWLAFFREIFWRMNRRNPTI